MQQASYFSSASPRGDCIVYLRETGICKQNLHRQGPAIANTAAGFHHTKVTSLRWSDDGSQVLIVSDRGVKVIEVGILLDTALLTNGSGGLGKIVSADFVGNEHLLAVWEFGKTKLWHLLSGKSVDLPDVKMICEGRAWQMRPSVADADADAGLRLFAMLHRTGAEDHLALNFSSLTHAMPLIKLPTTDAQSLSWSPDGRWLAILDVPTASPCLHIYTPDGHIFRSYPSLQNSDTGLGIKDIAWSPDGRILALSKYDGRVEVLNTKTFTPLAVVEHSTTIDQKSLPSEHQARVWQQIVSASNVRTYTEPPQPISPPLSRAKPTTEPAELGVAELCFSCDGRYLATRDCRMLNTVWVWEVLTLVAHSVMIQHGIVRKLLWHPSEPSLLLIDCAEGIATVYDVSTADEPRMFPTAARPRATLSWIATPRGGNTTIMATEKTMFKLIFPDGQDDNDVQQASPTISGAPFEEGASEDSLFDVLSGRKPLPPKTNPSYTEMMDLDMEAENTADVDQLDDTFREKRKAAQSDPLDDSEFF